ncbi:hypothetical protein GCM10027293_05440 [Pontibacter aydingkolensis]
MLLEGGEDLSPNINFEHAFVEPNATQLDHMRELADACRLQVHVSGTYSLDEAADALSRYIRRTSPVK